MVSRLLVDDFLPEVASCHFARTTFGSAGWATAPEPHCHDFLELFWVEDGTGIEVTPHGRHALRPGTITLVAEDDAHGFTTDGTRCRIVNIAFRSTLWHDLHARLMPLAPDPFAVPALKRLAAPASCLVDLALFVEEIEGGARGHAATERLLLNILWLMERERLARAPRARGAPLAGQDPDGGGERRAHQLCRTAPGGQRGQSPDHLPGLRPGESRALLPALPRAHAHDAAALARAAAAHRPARQLTP